MLLQSLVRAERKSRLATQTLKVHVRREESSIERFQTAIHGALKCKAFEEQYAETQDAGEGVEYLQAALRGMLQPSQPITQVQAAARARTIRLRQENQAIESDGGRPIYIT